MALNAASRIRYWEKLRNLTRPDGLLIGDKIAILATPIARALGLPCIDPQTKDLRPESGCAKRKQKLNALLR